MHRNIQPNNLSAFRSKQVKPGFTNYQPQVVNKKKLTKFSKNGGKRFQNLNNKIPRQD